MIDKKRLDEIESWHNDKTSKEVLSHMDFDGLIRLARLGLWAESFGIPTLQQYAQYEAPMYYEAALAYLPKEQK